VHYCILRLDRAVAEDCFDGHKWLRAAFNSSDSDLRKTGGFVLLTALPDDLAQRRFPPGPEKVSLTWQASAQRIADVRYAM